MKGVKELSKMRNLWRLNLRFERSDVDVNDALDLVVHAAGKVPNLKKFEFEIIPAGQDIDEAFVVKFGVLYKEKELCLCKIRSG
jgi:hypothetical protein